MENQKTFEYATIRLVPRVEREEFMNVGVILYCKESSFMKLLFHVDESRLPAFPPIDLNQTNEYLLAYQKLCDQTGDSDLLKMPIGELFRWMTAPRNTVLQFSPVHCGLCSIPEEMLKNIFGKMVLN